MIQRKSALEPRQASDGYRILVEPIWPQGLPKGKSGGVEWMKSLGPSENLRGWMMRNPRKVPSFTDKYLAELARNDRAVERVAGLLKRWGTITIVESPVQPGQTDWGVAETLVRYLRANCE